MSSFKHAFSAADMIPSPDLIVGGLTAAIALKIRGVLAHPGASGKEMTLSTRKTFDRISVSAGRDSLEFFLAGNAFAEADKLVYLLPFTPESFIENLDRLILRKLRGKAQSVGGESDKTVIKSSKSRGSSPSVEDLPRIALPFSALTKAVIGWAEAGEIDAKLVKLMAAKALFKGKDSHDDIGIRVSDARISIGAEGAFLILDHGFFTCNMRQILSAMPSKLLGVLDKNLTRIAY